MCKVKRYKLKYGEKAGRQQQAPRAPPPSQRRPTKSGTPAPQTADGLIDANALDGSVKFVLDEVVKHGVAGRTKLPENAKAKNTPKRSIPDEPLQIGPKVSPFKLAVSFR